MNFVQAMIVPTMVSMGMGSLLVAQNLSLMEVSYAAPAGAEAGAKPGDAKPPAGGAPALPPPVDGAANPEFGAANGGGVVEKATSETDLSVKAVEAAGREDPFMALVPPDPGAIKPPIADLPPPKLPPIVPLPTPKPVVLPTPKPVPTGPVVVKGTPTPKPFGGDKAPTADQPQWLVRGIVSTGYERICMLEGKAGNNLSGRVGEVLADGSRIEAISNRGVTFIRGGRRYVKIIGGIL